MEPRCNERPRDWQNMFVITMFVNFVVLPYILLLLELKKKFVKPRTSLWRFHCNINFHINGIFVGIRFFQHLNLLLARFGPISLVRKPQNACLYKSALLFLFLTSAFSNQQGYVAFATMRNRVFFMKVLD